MPHPLDVIVIGAGIVGCAVGRELARRGAAVTIVDSRAVGMGATQASAGILAPYIETRVDDPLFQFTVRSLDLYDEFVAGVTTESGLSTTYRRTGTLDVAVDEADMAALERTHAALVSCRVTAELLDAAAVRVEEPRLSENVLGGLLIPAHGFVSATDLARATAVSASRYGAELALEHGLVSRVGRSRGRLIVKAEQRTFVGDAVVLAAGTWSGGIDIDGGSARVPVKPIRGQLLHLDWHGPPLRRVVWSPDCYLVPWDDGTLLVGATMEEAGFDEGTTVAGVRDLLDAACAVVSHAWTAGFRGARAGLRPATADGLPIIGPSSAVPNLVYATGHFRNGVLLAPLTAQLVADIVLDGRIDPALSAFTPARFGAL